MKQDSWIGRKSRLELRFVTITVTKQMKSCFRDVKSREEFNAEELSAALAATKRKNIEP
ncbi:MAG: hypothetical protein ACE5IR_10645 [bacterium]